MANHKIVTVQGAFPALSATFILDQITGLLDRGFEIQNWSTKNPTESAVHPSVESYALSAKTKYLQFPASEVGNAPDAWTRDFVIRNALVGLDKVEGFHVHYGALFNLLLPLFQFLPRYVLVSFHGYDASRYPKQHGANCYAHLFQRANRISTPSEFMKQQLVNLGASPEKIMVHRYGVDSTKFQQEPQRAPGEARTILSVARLVEKKGLEYSLRAFQKVCHSRKTRYRIVGDGELLGSLKTLTQELGIADQVDFLGALERESVVEEMRRADIFVLTSVTAKSGDQEGVPVALIEAHAAGLPVIASIHTGTPELVRHGSTGFLAKERDVETIAEHLLLLVENAEMRADFSRQARARVREEFDITRLNDRLAATIREGIAR